MGEGFLVAPDLNFYAHMHAIFQFTRAPVMVGMGACVMMATQALNVLNG